jgi:hypothetical protein
MVIQKLSNKLHYVTSQKMVVCLVYAVRNKNIAIQFQICTKEGDTKQYRYIPYHNYNDTKKLTRYEFHTVQNYKQLDYLSVVLV